MGVYGFICVLFVFVVWVVFCFRLFLFVYIWLCMWFVCMRVHIVSCAGVVAVILYVCVFASSSVCVSVNVSSCVFSFISSRVSVAVSDISSTRYNCIDQYGLC